MNEITYYQFDYCGHALSYKKNLLITTIHKHSKNKLYITLFSSTTQRKNWQFAKNNIVTFYNNKYL